MEAVEGSYREARPEHESEDLSFADPSETSASIPASEPEATTAPDVAAPPSPYAPAFEARSVHQNRFRIETLVGPATPTAPQAPRPEADMSEESEHIRRLLDSLD